MERVLLQMAYQPSQRIPEALSEESVEPAVQAGRASPPAAGQVPLVSAVPPRAPPRPAPPSPSAAPAPLPLPRPRPRHAHPLPPRRVLEPGRALRTND